jgi:DNA-binding transcriptional LysR family regulator
MELDVRRLRVLREVALRGTVAAAAEGLGFTPSAISQQLTALERESGTVLFERAGRKLRLTDAGRILVARTEPVLAALEEAASALEAAKVTVAGDLRVSALPSVARVLVIPVIRQLSRDHPDLHITMLDYELDAALNMLRLADLDVVVGHEYDHARLEATPDVIRVELFAEEMFVAATKGRFSGPVPLADLATSTWAAEPPDSSCGQAVRDACRSAGFEPDVRFNSTEFAVVLAAVAEGAVSLLPRLAFVDAPKSVEALQVADLQTRRHIFVAYRPGTESRPSVAALIERLTDGANRLWAELSAA